MKISKGLILIIFSIIFSYEGLISQETNPFDIKSRLIEKQVQKEKPLRDTAKIKVVKSEDTIFTNTVNPFDIDRDKIDSLGENIPVKSRSIKTNISIDYLKKVFSGNSSGFLVWIVLLILVLTAIVVSMNRDSVLKIVRSAWFNNMMNLLYRNFNNKDMLLYGILYLNFIFNLSLLIYLLLESRFELNGFILYLCILLFVIIIYLVKHFSLMLFNHVFFSLKDVRFYNFSVMVFNVNLGLALILVNLFAAFSPDIIGSVFLKIGLFLLVTFYIFRIIRGFLSTYNYFVVSIFHFFMYLCAFEILPLLLLLKIVFNMK
jgi:hypothetical protein